MFSRDFIMYANIWTILITVAGITADIIEGPSNTVAEIGQEVSLNCTALFSVDYWYFSYNGDGSNDVLITRPDCSGVKLAFTDHYAVEDIGVGNITSCNLIVFNITMEQAGVYKCYGGQTFFFSILTVIESPPVITVNSTSPAVEHEVVMIECRLNYNGPVAPGPTLRPHFNWTTEQNWIDVSSANESITENTVVSQLMVDVYRQDITSCTCHVYLQLVTSTKSGYANNIPSVNSSASSPIIEVLFYPDASIGALYPQYTTIGGTLCERQWAKCNAVGNPLPSVEWFDTKDNVSLSNDDALDLAEIGRSYTCVATNAIRDVVYHGAASFTPASNGDAAIFCRFPHNESTWTNVTYVDGCNNGTCACSDEYDRLTLTCNADTFPDASYKWIGPGNSVIEGQVLSNVTSNGVYHCMVYIDVSTSDYTGADLFPNATREEIVTECTSSQTAVPTIESTTSTSKTDKLKELAKTD